jgi:hypothetical protein
MSRNQIENDKVRDGMIRPTNRAPVNVLLFGSLLLCTKIEMSDERTPGDVSYQKLSISKLKSLLSARGVAIPHVKDQPKEVEAATPQSNTRLFNRCSTTLGCTKPTS